MAKGQGLFLLIKGKSGTGKTTLALELLDESSNPYYISIRVRPEYFLRQFPKSTEFLSPDRIIDATQIPSLETPPAKRNVPKLYEKVHFQDFPEFFEILYNKIMEQKSEKPPTIVIDSWNALEEMEQESSTQYPKQKTSHFENVFSEWVQHEKINLILILESLEPTKLDSIADGIIILKDSRINGLRVRTVGFQKLRTERIRQPEYVFTLDSGHFRSFFPYKFKLPEIFLRPEPISDLNSGTISTGMQSFDDLLQVGYPQGSWHLYELSNGVGEAFLQLLIPTLVNQLNLGRGVIAILPEGLSLKNFEIYLEGFVDGEKIAQQFVIIDRSPIGESIRSKTAILGDTLLDTLNEIHRQEDLFASYIDGPVLKLIGLDKLEHTYSVDDLRKLIPNEIAYTKSTSNISLTFMKEEQNLVNTFSHLANRHYRLELIDKALLMRGIQPQTDYVGLVPIISGGNVDTKFIPII